jgi:hypothetical protein
MERLCLGRRRVVLLFDGQKIEKELFFLKKDQLLPGWLTIKENPKMTYKETKFNQKLYDSFFVSSDG